MFEIYTQRVENPKDAHKIGRELTLGIAEKKLGYVPEILISNNGKPYIEGLHFNISHSHGLVVCVFGDKEVGVDTEKIREYRPRVAKNFHPAEIARLEEAEDINVEFFRIWTMKEAHLKCSGKGISKDLSSFNVFDLPNMHTEIRDEYIISICEE